MSKKIKASMKARAMAGKHLTGFAPYGYVKDENDKDVWHIDEEAAAVIREIFKKYIGGMTSIDIARELNERGMLPPREHGETKHGRPAYGKHLTVDSPPVMWRTNAVLTILDRYELCGHTVSCKSTCVSYKTKDRVRIPKEDWIITRDTHPAIIDEETWQTAHQIRLAGRRRPERVLDKGPLNGFLFCADCHNKLHFHGCDRLKNTNGTFDCSYHTSYHLCTSHYIHRDEVEIAVLADLQHATTMASEHESDFLKAIEKKTSSCGKANLRRYQKELTDGQKRLREIDQIINKLFESKVLGDLSPERFATMLATYEGEQATLRRRLEDIQTTINKEKEKTDGAEQFIRLVKRFSEIAELTDEIVATFIQRVEVHKPVKVDGKKQHEITVFYNFIGEMVP